MSNFLGISTEKGFNKLSVNRAVSTVAILTSASLSKTFDISGLDKPSANICFISLGVSYQPSATQSTYKTYNFVSPCIFKDANSTEASCTFFVNGEYISVVLDIKTKTATITRTADTYTGDFSISINIHNQCNTKTLTDDESGSGGGIM